MAPGGSIHVPPGTSSNFIYNQLKWQDIIIVFKYNKCLSTQNVSGDNTGQ